MRGEFLDKMGDTLDTLFAVAMAAAIGFGAANLAIQLNKEPTAFDDAAASQKLGQSAHSPLSPDAGIADADKTGLNFKIVPAFAWTVSNRAPFGECRLNGIGEITDALSFHWM